MHLGMLGGRRVASAQRRRQSHSQVMVNSVNGRVRIYQTRMVRTYASNGRRIGYRCTNRHTRNRCRNSNSKVVVYLGIDCGRICSTRQVSLHSCQQDRREDRKQNGHTRYGSCQSNSHVTGFFELGCVRICTTRKVGQTTRRGVVTPMDKPSTDAARAPARSLSS